MPASSCPLTHRYQDHSRSRLADPAQLGATIQLVIRTWLALAVLCAGTARGAPPSYSAAGIVNASNFTAGPFAPNSVLSIFGSGLARSEQAMGASDIKSGMLPLELNYVRVYVQ